MSTVCAAETGVKGEPETKEESICDPSAFKLQVEFLSSYINMDANICGCVYM